MQLSQHHCLCCSCCIPPGVLLLLGWPAAAEQHNCTKRM